MRLHYLVNIFICAVLLLSSCAKDDENNPDSTPPDDFKLLSPSNDTFDIDVYPTLTWQEAKDAEGKKVTYTILLDKKRNPTTVIASSLEDNTYTFTSRLSVFTTYYWKVIAEDPYGNIKESEVFKFFTRGLNIPDSPKESKPKFDERILSNVVEFKNKLWIIAGFNSGYKNDVWNSTDGIRWVKVVNNAPFYPRGDHEIIVFKDKLWLIGGIGADIYRDIWNSADGINWDLVTDDAPFGPRYGHTLTVFDDNLWLIGGAANGSEGKNDVWMTDDGINWIQVRQSAEFDPRMYHTTLSFEDRLWVICGYSFRYNDEVNEVWSSEDGLFWQFEPASLVFPRASHTSFVFDDKMWVIGGYNGNYLNDILCSDNGTLWEDANRKPIKFLPRASHYSIVFDEKIWMHGGYLETQNGTTRILSDIWEFD